MQREFRINVPITKIDEEKRMVYGIATSEMMDSQGDIVDYEASKAAFPKWLGNIREMHEPIAVGKNMETEFDDVTKQVMIGAYISESTDGENSWIKVKEGVLQGFSIGGSVNKVSKEVVKKDGVDVPVTRIVDYDLSEVSLVDNPANPEAMFVMVKSQKGGLQRVEEVIKKADIKKMTALPAWHQQFMIPIEKAQALYDNSMKKGQTDMKKGLWDAAWLLDLALSLSSYINMEEYEDEDVTDLKAALETIKAAVVTELTEPTTELTVAVELAEKVTNLKKGSDMSKKDVKKADEAVETPAVDAEDTKVEEPKADEAVATPAASEGEDKKEDEKVEDAPAEGAEDAGAEADKAPEKAEGEAEGESSDEGADDEAEKAVTVGDLRKFSEGLISKLGDGNKAELTKALGEFTDKVEKSVSSLEGRIKTLEDQPVASKGKASFADVTKGDESNTTEDAEVQELIKRSNELAANPNLGTPEERFELSGKLRKAQAAGHKLT